MKIAISNIAWDKAKDVEMYDILRDNHIEGLEIAPTRLFPERPYEKVQEAIDFVNKLKIEYGLLVPSMQSIWYGKTENIWDTESDRKELLEYTKKAIDFASAIKCKNIVFGCPKNRAYHGNIDESRGIEFFKELGDYAAEKETCIGMEANPPIYNTNYINTTKEAIELINKVGSEGFKLNLDIGTMIQNGEAVDILCGNECMINHVHISEPGLAKIEKREIHKELLALLENDYKGYISLEMSKQCEIEDVIDSMLYIKNIYS